MNPESALETTAEHTAEGDLERTLAFVRPAVRRQKPYLVGGVAEPRVKLNQNESPFDLPEDLKRELLGAFLEIPFNRYPEEQPWALQHAIAARLGLEPDAVLVGNGSNELTYTLALALVAPGTPVVLPRPMFSLYENVMRMYDADVVSIAPRPDLGFDVEAIREAVRTRRPALTVLTTPNNPTGLALSLPEVESVVREAEGFVLVDEAYVEFTEEESALAILDRYPNLLLMRTMSKAFGLAGMRVGYLAGHPVVMRELLKARVPFMVDPLAQATALALLRRPGLLAERAAFIKRSCRELTEALRSIAGVEVVPSQANFVLFKTSLDPAGLLRRLAEAGVLVRNMGGYPELRGFLRVNAGTPEENQVFLTALKVALQPS